MHYITHPLAPMLALAGRKVSQVACFGSGAMPPGFEKNYQNPYPIETAVFELGTEALSPGFPIFGDPQRPLSIQITCITATTAVQNKETFDVFGSKQSFVWANHWGDEHTLIRRTLTEPKYFDKSNPVMLSHFQTPAIRRDLPDALRKLPGQPQANLQVAVVTGAHPFEAKATTMPSGRDSWSEKYWPRLWDEFTGLRQRDIQVGWDGVVEMMPVTGHELVQGWSGCAVLEEWYALEKPEGEPFLTTPHPNSGPVLGWTRRFRGNRVACLQPGHGVACWTDPAWQELFRRTLVWAAQKG